MKSVTVSEATTQLSSLVEEATGGERVVISEGAVPRAMLGPLPKKMRARKPAGVLQISYIADDFDAPDLDIAGTFSQDDGVRF